MANDEMQLEQAHIDRAYERLEVLRQRARARAEGVLDRASVSTHQDRYQRDVTVHESHMRLAQLQLGSLPLVFGRIDDEDGARYHVGRVAVPDEDRDPLVVDWRAPVAEPFYRATPRAPLGLVRRRRFRTRRQRLLGIDDELMGDDAGGLELLGEGALLGALERARTGRMRDIVETIQAEQDAIIRAPLRGVLVVQGGPGTGKTAVALHRAAYLVYTHRQRLAHQGVLLVGPSGAFLRYVEDVLPALGEQGVLLSTIADLVAGAKVTAVEDQAVARLKGEARMAAVLARARPASGPEPALHALLTDAGRLAEAAEGVLSADEQSLIVRHEWAGWTPADLPLLDVLAARQPGQGHRKAAIAEEQRWEIERLVDEIAAAQPLDPAMAEGLVSRLADARQQEEQQTPEDDPVFGHVVVDEAQDLSPLEWRMLGRRCPSGSMTVVGDLAQATGAWAHDTWEDAVAALGRPVQVTELTVNYRTPEEIMVFADRLRSAALPPGRAVRRTGAPPDVRKVPAGALADAVRTAVDEALGAVEGTIGVIVAGSRQLAVPHDERVTVSAVPDAKGIEFDAVVVVEPAAIADEHGARALYVALTRPTQRLLVVHSRSLPHRLADGT